VDPARADELAATTGATVDQFAGWIRLGAAHAHSLPPKRR
jgi:hypothetical protein